MKLKLTVPNDLGEIKLSDYVKYLKVLEVNEDDAYSDVFVHQKVLEIFCGVPLLDAVEYKMSDVRKVVQIITSYTKQTARPSKDF